MLSRFSLSLGLLGLSLLLVFQFPCTLSVLSLLFLSCSYILSDHVQSGLFQLPLAVLCLITIIKTSSSVTPSSGRVLIFIHYLLAFAFPLTCLLFLEKFGDLLIQDSSEDGVSPHCGYSTHFVPFHRPHVRTRPGFMTT